MSARRSERERSERKEGRGKLFLFSIIIPPQDLRSTAPSLPQPHVPLTIVEPSLIRKTIIASFRRAVAKHRSVPIEGIMTLVLLLSALAILTVMLLWLKQVFVFS